MTATSKLYLCNFTLPNAYGTFFYNVTVAKAAYFYFCPCFYEAFLRWEICKKSVVYCRFQEIACCYLDCRKELFLFTSYIEEPNDYFNNLKKNLIRYFNDINRHNNEAVLNV